MSIRVSRRTTQVAIIGLLVGAVSGCTPGGQPSPSAGDLTAVIDALSARHVMIQSAVSGDPGCAMPTLSDNALRLEIRLPDTSEPDEVYLLRFRPRDFDASLEDVEACAAELAARNPGLEVERIDLMPFRVLGVGWSEQAGTTVREALEAVGATPATND